MHANVFNRFAASLNDEGNMSKREDREDIYRAHVAGESCSAIGKRLNLTSVRIRQIVASEARLDCRRKTVASCSDWRDIPTRDVMDLSARTTNTLYYADYEKIGDVAAALEAGHLNIRKALMLPNFGRRCWVELVAWMSERGIVLPD